MKQTLPTPSFSGGSATIPLPGPGTLQGFNAEADGAETLLRVEGLRKTYPGNSRSGRGALSHGQSRARALRSEESFERRA